MNSSRRVAIIVGTLFIVGTIAGVLSVVPSIDDNNYLIQASAHANQVIAGATFQLIMTAAYVGVAILLYPILRKFNESLALGFVGFRIISGMFIVVGVISLLLLLSLSEEFVRAGAPNGASFFQTLGALLRLGRDLVNHVAMILALSTGGLMFYSVLYQSKLVPRWLSGWGLAGTLLTMFASALIMFRLIEIISPAYLLLNVPMALQEMVLAVILIVKGFNPSAIAAVSSAVSSKEAALGGAEHATGGQAQAR